MPFITKDRRIQIDAGHYPSDVQQGDRCYRHYKFMVDWWKKEPRWTTAHYIYRHMLDERPYLIEDEAVAMELAWQVFFQNFVMPYEKVKEAENGTI